MREPHSEGQTAPSAKRSDVDPAEADQAQPGGGGACKSRLAIASLVVAIGGLVWVVLLFITDSLSHLWYSHSARVDRLYPLFVLAAVALPGAVAIGLGTWARRQIVSSGGLRTGKGLAAGGIVLGVAGIALGVLALATEISVHRYEPSLGAKVSRVRSDMRSLSTAIEAYYVEHNIYPGWGIGDSGPGGTETYNHRVVSQLSLPERPRRSRGWYLERKEIGSVYWYKHVPYDATVVGDLPNFLLNGEKPGQRFATLTTPNAYITSYPRDPFSPIPGTTFVFWSVFPGERSAAERMGRVETPIGGVGWILVCPGPDLKYDLPLSPEAYDPSIAQPSKWLLTGTNDLGHAFTYDPTNGVISHGDVWRVKQ